MSPFDSFLLPFYILPFATFFLLFARKWSERSTYVISYWSCLLPFLATLAYTAIMINEGVAVRQIDLFSIPIAEHHSFHLIFIMDALSLTILFLTGPLSLIVTHFSHHYLHREAGHQRFFRTIMLFIFGLHLLSLAGSLTLFFAGWEIIGLCSFLLIAFYRDRTRPVKNAYRIYGLYRITDSGLLFGAIIGQVLWANADHFTSIFTQANMMKEYINPLQITLLSLLLLLSAVGKSGQFPFLSWPARAMEGPTPSSAIFYGALSIHCGVFLLHRTYPLWSQSFAATILIAAIGLLSFFFATLIGRTQPSIKGQIAYSTVAQIGLMFTLLAFGFTHLVLIYIIFHALFRCYQMLTSPSSVVDVAKNLSHHHGPKEATIFDRLLPSHWRATKAIWAIQEGGLSLSERNFFGLSFIKMKFLARKLACHKGVILMILLVSQGLAYWQHHTHWTQQFSYLLAAIDFIISLYCLTSTGSAKRIWGLFLIAQLCFISSSFLFDYHHMGTGILFYTLSAIPGWLCGYLALNGLPDLPMTNFHGLTHLNPKRTTFFMISMIILTGLPFSTTFWGEDLIFGELIGHAPVLLFFTSISIMMNGLISVRILTKVFWGHPAFVKV
jgi:NADH-quinone oxidoreductase subunit L